MPKVKTIEQLRRELVAKESLVERLETKREKLAAKLEALDRQIAAVKGEGAPAKAGRKAKAGVKRGKRGGARRARGGKSLVDSIKEVLGSANEPLRVKEVMAAVQKQGYKSGSKNFYGIVATALRDTENFKKADRGRYCLA